MPHLTNFTVQHFKAFGKAAPVAVSPVTLLFGPNSAGKSSFLHGLKLYAELLTARHLHPAGLPLGNWVHGRQPDTSIRFEAEVQLLPTEVGLRGDLDESTERITLGIELGVGIEGEVTSGYDVEAFLRRVRVQVNGQPAFTFKGESYVEPKTGWRTDWTGLSLDQVNWNLPELARLVESTANRIVRECEVDESRVESPDQLRQALHTIIREAWQKVFLIRSSDLLIGRARMFRRVEFLEQDAGGVFHDRGNATYNEADPPGVTFIFTAVKFVGGDLQRLHSDMADFLFRQGVAYATPDSWLNGAMQDALKGDFDGLANIVSALGEPELVLKIGENIHAYREDWQKVQEISSLLAFGLEELTHAFSQFLRPVVQVMASMHAVGPVRQVGEVTAGQQDSWQSLLAQPRTRELVNKWLARLRMDYEVVQARLIDEEQLAAATAQAAARAELNAASKLILILDESMEKAGLGEDQVRSLRALLRARVQEEQLEDAIGFSVIRKKDNRFSEKLRASGIATKDMYIPGLSPRLREHVARWFPEQSKHVRDWPTDVLFRAWSSVKPDSVRTNQTPTLLKLRDKRSGLMLDDTDLGVGVSQLLPVLARAAIPGLVVIEQPELHVHPALQADLADIMIEAANQHGVTLVLETHSEHLILRLLKRIRETADRELREELLRFTPQDLSVLFVQAPQQGQAAVIRKLPINEDGEVVGRWPQGFFADRSEDLL